MKNAEIKIWEHLEKYGKRMGKSGTDLENIWVKTGSTMGLISDQRIVSIGKVWEAPTPDSFYRGFYNHVVQI